MLNGSRWVLDTGAPFSLGDADRHPLEATQSLNRSIEVSPGHHANALTVSQYLGISVAGVIGCDFLNHHDLIFDFSAGELKFGDDILRTGQRHALSFPPALKGLPTIKAKVGGQEGDFIFDTGAQISYFFGTPPTDRIDGEEILDFWLGEGVFRAQTYAAKVAFTDYATSLRFGVPPPSLREAFRPQGILGIIGLDLISQQVCRYQARLQLMTIVHCTK